MLDFANFAHQHAQRADRWSLLFDFLQAWDLPRSNAPSIASHDILAAEQRLGQALPRALKEWYQLPHNLFFLKPRLFWTHLIEPDELALWPTDAPANEQYLVFLAEYQYCGEWALRATELHLPDPPVSIGTTQEEPGTVPWQIQNSTFSEFVLHLTLVRAVHFAFRSYGQKAILEPHTKATLHHHARDCGFPVWHEYGSQCTLMGISNGLCLLNNAPPWGEEHELAVSTRDEASLDELAQMLDIEWDWTEDKNQELNG